MSNATETRQIHSEMSNATETRQIHSEMSNVTETRQIHSEMSNATKTRQIHSSDGALYWIYFQWRMNPHQVWLCVCVSVLSQR